METTNSVKSVRGRKRKRWIVQEYDKTPMVELMSSFFTEMNSQIGQLVSKFGVESDASAKRKNIFDALDKLTDISVEDKLDVAKFLERIPSTWTFFMD